MSDQTRVYTEGGTVAHLLSWNASPNDPGAEALCGRSVWPGYWWGTGSQEEHERALDMRLCAKCEQVLSNRLGGMRER